MTVAHPLNEICEQLEKAFSAIDSMALPEHVGPLNADPDASHTWFPNLEIDETPEEYVVAVELRGLDPDELTAEIEGGALMLATRHALRDDLDDALDNDEPPYDEEARDEANPEEEDFGECVCEVSLPGNVEGERAVVVCEAGLLKITLPKSPTR